MAIEDLYVPSASQNPIRADRLPKIESTVEFPILLDTPEQRKNQFREAIKSQLFIATGVLCINILPSISEFHFFVVLLLCVASFGLSILGKLLRKSSYADWPTVLIFPAVAVAGIYFANRHPNRLIWLTSAGLLAYGLAIESHFKSLAITGLFTKEQADAFKKKQTLPFGLRALPSFASAREALMSFLTYNHLGVKAPGTAKSPIGGYTTRNALVYSLLAFLVPAIMLIIRSGRLPLPEILTFHPLPLCIAVVLGSVAIANLVGMFWASLECGTFLAMGLAAFDPRLWHGFIARLHRVGNSIERDSLLLGLVDFDRSPILYPINALFRHAWIVGKTGSGKSSFILLLLDQLVRWNKVSVVYIDLKATSFEAIAAMKRAAATRSQGNAPTLKEFTLQHGLPSYLFDLFSQSWWPKLSLQQRTGVILSAMGLIYSRAYGQSWYTDSAYECVAFVLKRHPDIKSWDELAKRLEDAMRQAKHWELSESVRKDGVHAQLVAKRFASFAPLNAQDDTAQSARDAAIDFADAFESPNHFYFGLSAIQNPISAGEVGRLIATSLLNAAVGISKRKTRCILVIDEWQCMVTKDLTILLEQARGLGIGVVLANQTTSQLITPDADLRAVVEGNTSLQAWLQITDDIGREQVKRLGGQHIVLLKTKQVNPDKFQPSYSYSETIHDRVTPNLTSAVGSESERFLLRLTDNEGYACYGDLMFVARRFFHQAKDEYDRDCATPWPEPTPQTVINRDTPLAAPESPPVVKPPTVPPGSGKQLGRKPTAKKST